MTFQIRDWMRTSEARESPKIDQLARVSLILHRAHATGRIYGQRSAVDLGVLTSPVPLICCWQGQRRLVLHLLQRERRADVRDARNLGQVVDDETLERVEEQGSVRHSGLP